MKKGINGKIVVFKTGTVSVICPDCGYYNHMSGIRRYGTCKRCKCVIDGRVKFLYELDKMLNFKIKERRKRREDRRYY